MGFLVSLHSFTVLALIISILALDWRPVTPQQLLHDCFPAECLHLKISHGFQQLSRSLSLTSSLSLSFTTFSTITVVRHTLIIPSMLELAILNQAKTWHLQDKHEHRHLFFHLFCSHLTQMSHCRVMQRFKSIHRSSKPIHTLKETFSESAALSTEDPRHSPESFSYVHKSMQITTLKGALLAYYQRSPRLQQQRQLAGR